MLDLTRQSEFRRFAWAWKILEEDTHRTQLLPLKIGIEIGQGIDQMPQTLDIYGALPFCPEITHLSGKFAVQSGHHKW